MVKFETAALFFVLLPLVGWTAEATDRAGGKFPRLRLEVVRTLPEPVIGKNTAGAESIPGGFEGGNSVKAVIGGKVRYHFFAHSYPTMGWGRSQLDHWVSDDGRTFRRSEVMLADFEDQATGKKHIFTAPNPFYQEKEERWYLSYGEFVIMIGADWSPDSGTMWCAPSKVAGMAGVAGPYDFGKRFEFVTRQCLNKRPVSNSAPFQLKDGHWAVFVCPDGEVSANSGHWPIMLSFAPTATGPFGATPQLTWNSWARRCSSPACSSATEPHWNPKVSTIEVTSLK